MSAPHHNTVPAASHAATPPVHLAAAHAPVASPAAHPTHAPTAPATHQPATGTGPTHAAAAPVAHTHQVTYIWKDSKPRNAAAAASIRQGAYNTAIGPHGTIVPVEILIRGDIHNTTTVTGTNTRKSDAWHYTVSYKTAATPAGQHYTAHGYTVSQAVRTIQRWAPPSPRFESDNYVPQGKSTPIWPAGGILLTESFAAGVFQ